MTVSFPDGIPGLSPEARGTGLAAGVTGVYGLLPGDGPCVDRGCPPTLARDPRLSALSDEVCPQLASPARSSRLRRRVRLDCDKSMPSDLLDAAAMKNRERSAQE